MRQFPNILTQVIHQSALRLNTISKTSGISHTYLTKLAQGNINRPGKDKIASTLLSLNFSIGDINDILAKYDYQPLNRLDIPEILENNRRRKIEGSFLPSYDHIYFDMLLTSIEGLGGVKILVKDTPSSLFLPDELYLKREYPFTYEKDGRAEDFRHALSLALLRERKSLFLGNCNKGYRFETYICKRCLSDFLEAKLGSGKMSASSKDRDSILKYFANAIAVIMRNPDQHQTKIVERCAYYSMQLQNIDGKHPIVFFLGRKLHDYDNVYEQKNLEGFTSDSPSMIALFQKEIEIFRRAADTKIAETYPVHFIEHIFNLFKVFGLKNELQNAINEIADRKELSFF